MSPLNEFLNGIIVRKTSTYESRMATGCACLTNINLVIFSEALLFHPSKDFQGL